GCPARPSGPSSRPGACAERSPSRRATRGRSGTAVRRLWACTCEWASAAPSARLEELDFLLAGSQAHPGPLPVGRLAGEPPHPSRLALHPRGTDLGDLDAEQRLDRARDLDLVRRHGGLEAVDARLLAQE